ncbi:GTP-binding protein [Amaricoccus macauensis]|uniref:Large ribosomal subunit assembly factor BipA n=1 Tax=Amaricoccus macauensis TaxID=57001 RepID=A0A840SQN7_9RHOB|nr:translational GTPase TypA [Amaricoccus macauensis]MBB5221663.1 GTP-binding protein [Amaricoccus macauensis]
MDIRNIAIIAHVDHGKTTLVDALLKQSGTFRDNQATVERAMDSNDLERERGITILAKATSVEWHGHRINIVDTPGHADFGGEVERILGMVDGVVLLVDAAEGPMPQTKFVTSKALRLGLKPIVVLNKVDKPDAEPDRALNEVFDLFVTLDANEEQLDFPVLYASGRAGWADTELDGPRQDLSALYQLVVDYVPAPTQLARADEPFSMLATTLASDPYLGRLLTGRIETGTVRTGQSVHALSRDGTEIERFRISKILAFRGLARQPIEVAEAGDIVSLAGMTKATVADTIADLAISEPIPAQPIDPPTISVTFGINDSPLAGRDGDKVQSRVIRDRLLREAESNVAIRVTDTPGGDAFEVAGRGELQMGVLIENMRREGFELSISRPRVIFRDEDGGRLEPVEEVTVDVDEEFSGVVVEKLSQRKGELAEMRTGAGGKTRIVAHVPSRGLIGYHGEFLTDTRGTGILNRVFHGWSPHKGSIPSRRNGVLVSIEDGVSVSYALFNLEDRGRFFIGSGEQVYQGMILGEHSRDNDLEVNPLKGKKLTNVRASGKDEAVVLTPPARPTLEQAIAYVEDDELVEVTPRHIRLRKRYLDPHERKRESRKGA